MRLSPRISLLIIAGLFLLPLALAWFMYTGTIDYKPAATRNLGKLVEPPLPISWESIETIPAAGGPAKPATEDLATHWVVLRRVTTPCDDSCVEQVTQLRQVHRAAGRNQSRVRIALLLSSPDSGAIGQLKQIYTEFRFIDSADGTLETIMRQASGDLVSTYLIDPLGNIMMVYENGADPNHLKKDLKRLLTWSKLDE